MGCTGLDPQAVPGRSHVGRQARLRLRGEEGIGWGAQWRVGRGPGGQQTGVVRAAGEPMSSGLGEGMEAA